MVATHLQAFATILGQGPLEILFGLYNPPRAPGPVSVPRPLAPLGYFVRLHVTAEDGQTVHSSAEPKARLKLHPERAASYRELDPGYLHGVVFTLEKPRLGAGSYVLHLSYSNRQFGGPPEAPIGALHFELRVPLLVE